MLSQEAIYIDCWPNTSSAWTGWRRFYILVDISDGVHYLQLCTTVNRSLLPVTRLASRKILIEQNIKRRTGPALCVFSLLDAEYNGLHYTNTHITIKSERSHPVISCAGEILQGTVGDEVGYTLYADPALDLYIAYSWDHIRFLSSHTD
jgi:hypothetical protein